MFVEVLCCASHSLRHVRSTICMFNEAVDALNTWYADGTARQHERPNYTRRLPVRRIHLDKYCVSVAVSAQHLVYLVPGVFTSVRKTARCCSTRRGIRVSVVTTIRRDNNNSDCHRGKKIGRALERADGCENPMPTPPQVVLLVQRPMQRHRRRVFSSVRKMDERF